MKSVKQVKPNGIPGPSRYNALFFRIGLSVLAAHIIVVYGETESTLSMMLTRAYYIAMTGSIIIAFLLISYVHYINQWLNRRLDWEYHQIQRGAYQLVLGLLVPGVLAFLMAALYFQIVAGVSILRTSYLRFDFQFIMLLLFCLNVYYYAEYQNSGWLAAKALLREQQPQEKENVLRETFLVHTPVRVLPLRTEQICYFFRKNGHNFVHTFGSDVYAIPESLKEIEDRFGGQHFFRINRQMVINFQACVSFRPGKNKTLELALNPAFSLKHRDEDTHNGGGSFVTVSEDRVQAFKEWMDR